MDSLVSGKLSYVLLVGIVDAAILSWLALFWFRRAVRRLMRRTGRATRRQPSRDRPEPGSAPASPAAAPSGPTFAIFEAADDAGRAHREPASASSADDGDS